MAVSELAGAVSAESGACAWKYGDEEWCGDFKGDIFAAAKANDEAETDTEMGTGINTH
jgi:hypothetical protein